MTLQETYKYNFFSSLPFTLCSKMSGIYTELNFTFALWKGWAQGSLILVQEEVPSCYRLWKWLVLVHPREWFSRAMAPEKSNPEWLSLGQMQQFFIPVHLPWLLLRRNHLITQGAHSDRAAEHKQIAAPAEAVLKPALTGMLVTGTYQFTCGLPFPLRQGIHSDFSFGKG